MAKAIISYDKDLPEIPDRRPWEKPTSFLVKDATTESGWRVDASGRRPSHLLLIPKLRTAVDQWRNDGYPAASEVTLRLFAYWFDEDHEVAGFAVPFRYHFCQREAIETLAYLVEVARIGDAKVLVDAYAEVFHRDLLSKSIEFQTTMDGQRQIRRYVPELEAEGVQDLPPEDLRRYAFKMATGSGKTWVMAMAMVWSLFHKKREPGSDLSTNFLIVAPNVIVYQRLEKDFGSNRIFHELPLIPPEWRGTWSQSLLSTHRALPKGLSLWLDFSATPKDQNGMYFPWTVCDYPLAQAVEDRIVKAPIIVTKEDDPRQPAQDPDHITKDNVAEKYGYWIQAAVQRWKEHDQTYRKLGTRPVLFIMAERNIYADAIGQYLWKTKEFGFRESEVLVIHTDAAGEITKKDLEQARQVARDIDQAGSRIKAIVSVMMLREGWDVRAVSVVLGLRPFTTRAEILPEQVIGRGLRLMTAIGPDRTQTLEVLGTRNLLNVLREQLEVEGVGVASTSNDPPRPVIIEPVQDRLAYDIAIPITKPRLTHNVRKLSALDPTALEAIYDQEDLDEVFRINLKMAFATTETEVHQADLAAGTLPMAQALLGAITNKVIRQAGLTNAFADLFPIVRTYVATRCFGKAIDVDHDTIRSHLQRLEMQEGIARCLARSLAELTVEKREIEFDKADFKLSATKPFQWRRNLPPLIAERTVFNYVATYNDFERRFAQFLDTAPDVLRFASLGTTEQGDSGTQFRVDYLKPSGAIGFYHPDWVVVQQTDQGEGNWIIETKGRVWEGTEAKDAAMRDWCARVSEQTGVAWTYVRVDQSGFDIQRPTTLAEVARRGGEAEACFLL